MVHNLHCLKPQLLSALSWKDSLLKKKKKNYIDTIDTLA